MNSKEYSYVSCKNIIRTIILLLLSGMIVGPAYLISGTNLYLLYIIKN